jgi:LacI family transcriptional regulator
MLVVGAPFFAERRAGIARYAREAGWVLDSRLTAFQAQGREAEYIASSRVDGVISMVTSGAPWVLKCIRQMDVPVVDMWYDLPAGMGSQVLLDHHAIGAAGAEHLLSRGLRNLLFYFHTVDQRTAGWRAEGFRERAGRAGVETRVLSWDAGRHAGGGGGGRVQWLAGELLKLGRPLGVMASNDPVGCEVLEAAELAGLRVPDEVAVLGVDNDVVVAELATVPLSSVDSARERVGYEAAALLDRLMSGEAAPRSAMRVAPAGVVTRRSTEVLAVEEEDVAEALRFIRDRHREAIGVDDVAAVSRLSRRRLQDRFRGAMGHGIAEEITRQRIEEAKRLLTGTEQKVDRIARLAGFAGGERMSKVFRREVGMTPGEFRKGKGGGSCEF